MNNDAQPEIRFPGFTDDWEQRKLGEVADIIGGGTPNTNNPEYWNGDIDWYAPAEIGKQIYVKNSQKKISQLGLQKSSAKILPIGTVLFTSRAGIGNTAILAKEGTTNQGFQSIVPHENKLDSYFIFSRTHELKRYGEVTGAGSTFAEVSGKQMAKMPILIPYIDEQQKIGIFFKKLDDTITLHQRKLDLLKETKKGFLQKMFPKNGAKVPEIRFPGFTEDWEERKLNEVSDIYDGTHQTPKYQDDGVMFLSVENIKTLTSNKFISREAFEDEFKIRPQRGDVLMTRIGDIGTANVVETDEDLAYYVSLALFKSEELNPYFLQASIYAPFVQDQIWKRTLHIAFPKKINKNEIGQVPINVPTLAEQTKIGAFFKQLDDTIALHQRELDVLKETKKGFLQKMFV
ncbi:restriction endonuclease subunit S [Enterococcus faecium]|nr:restriction endonuclease subunit S [Enterococcus faecium]EME7116423.1 restriction endonuclease subunit S [Enterococcus faecium]EMF0633012.1 restriction endonuclease subunit S [Enterococcus faecium]